MMTMNQGTGVTQCFARWRCSTGDQAMARFIKGAVAQRRSQFFLFCTTDFTNHNNRFSIGVSCKVV